ncbi:hypothetical protein KO494_03080 [Lacinutrix sp. C3R15]|uniref:DUF6515 family protein n=1 Tax=Flavobacteriaceae TaxID=49546 RepID=UPI001C082065|nr:MULTISPECIES: DUF6515 family protein [Flavobacteriaceae]MBU2938514.1 hypothetical protein [Lacinutrix sp. C3R15]MDO6621828.1 DUF6515 family protein [Oceanihabitans sp. 1_MG-2023]
MKTFIKTFILPIVCIVAFSATTTAQTRRTTNAKTVVTTTTKKTTANSRIPRSKVTYKKATRKVVSVRNVPNKTVVKHKGQNYYYANNKFYTQSRGRYIVIAPKVGFRVKALPDHYKRIAYNNGFYFNANGIFYVQINNEYEVVDPEIGTVVYELPEDYEKVSIDNQTYYEYANVLYEKVQVDGVRAYEVVGIIDID